MVRAGGRLSHFLALRTAQPRLLVPLAGGLLLLGGLLVIGACTGNATSSTLPTTAPSAPPASPGDLTTTTLAGPHGPERVQARGLTTGRERVSDPVGSAVVLVNVGVEVAPRASGEVKIEIVEREVGGTSAEWKAACWTAAVTAASLMGVPLSDFSIAYEVNGSGDASALGGLLTVATIAAFRGDPLLPDVTLLGGADPGYGASPTSGLLQKLEAATPTGTRLVLVPAGQRQVGEAGGTRDVDLVQRAKDLFIEVREVKTIGEAYRYMTGRTLPQAAGGERAPELSPEARAKLQGARENLIGHATDLVDAYAALPSGAKSDYTEKLRASAQKQVEDSKRFVLQDDIGAAYGEAQKAVYEGALAVLFVKVGAELRAGTPAGAAAAARTLGFLPDLESIRTRLLVTRPAHVAQASGLIAAWGDVVLAESRLKEADEMLSRVPKGVSSGADVNAAVFDYAQAARHLYAASDAMSLAEQAGGGEVRESGTTAAVAAGLLQAAQANVGLMDAAAVPEFAADARLSNEQAKERLAAFNGYYASARAAAARAAAISQDLPAGTARDYAVLGAALAGYVSSAVAVAESLGYEAAYDAGGTISGFNNAESLTAGLQVAADEATRSIIAADPSGGATALPILWREWGMTDSEGGDGDRMNALYDFWAAAVHARTLQLLAGRAGG